MKDVFNNLTDANKDVLNLVAKGMLVAQKIDEENGGEKDGSNHNKN